MFWSSNTKTDPLDKFMNCLEGVRWLDMPSESKVIFFLPAGRSFIALLRDESGIICQLNIPLKSQ